MKDEPLRRVISGKKCAHLLRHGSQSFCGNNLETAETPLTNIGAS
jgi:hypothetical protein